MAKRGNRNRPSRWRSCRSLPKDDGGGGGGKVDLTGIDIFERRAQTHGTRIHKSGDPKHITVTPSQLPITICGNNEITCGNSYSTL